MQEAIATSMAQGDEDAEMARAIAASMQGSSGSGGRDNSGPTAADFAAWTAEGSRAGSDGDLCTPPAFH